MPPIPTDLRHRDLPDVRARASQEQSNGNDPQLLSGDRKVIGVNGFWYDVTDFIHKHPGGPVIEQFIGKDATEPFNMQMHRDVLKYRKPVGTYTMKERHPADKEFWKLNEWFVENGFYKTDFVWYTKKVLVILLLFALMWVCVLAFEAWYMHYTGAFCLFLFWQQSGFMMHDLMHHQVSRKGKWDNLAGMFFGTVGVGVSAHWWQDEHIVHHAMTNIVDAATQFADPQMHEAVWAQNQCLFPLFKGLMQWFLIKIQHITFVPVVVFLGRYGILMDSFLLERRWYEKVATVLHWCWIVPLLAALPTWRERIIFYLIASSLEGVFHLQLILSHYCKQFQTSGNFHENSWYVHQIDCNMNIDTPWWQDWLYGGLNLHIEHHLYPKLARNKLREASKHIQKICEKHDIQYESTPFTTCLWRTVKHLKNVGVHYKLDPR